MRLFCSFTWVRCGLRLDQKNFPGSSWRETSWAFFVFLRMCWGSDNQGASVRTKIEIWFLNLCMNTLSKEWLRGVCLNSEQTSTCSQGRLDFGGQRSRTIWPHGILFSWTQYLRKTFGKWPQVCHKNPLGLKLDDLIRFWHSWVKGQGQGVQMAPHAHDRDILHKHDISRYPLWTRTDMCHTKPYFCLEAYKVEILAGV